MTTLIELGVITIEVIRKDIKNLHLNVLPPLGAVRISAPPEMKLNVIRTFAISKLDWIKRQQKKLQEQERESPREYIDRESHYVWGKRYLLKVIQNDKLTTIKLKHSEMQLWIFPDTSDQKKQTLVSLWYRAQLKQAVPAIISKWEALMGVKVEQFFVQKMKTKWGSCNRVNRHIRLNTELAKKPPEYLEYIIVHEMTHLLESRHNHRFKTLMDQFIPKWQFYREALNNSLLGYEEWQREETTTEFNVKISIDPNISKQVIEF